MQTIETVLGLLAAMSALMVLARRLSIAYPIVLVIGGLVISVLPGLPRVELEPDITFLLFLPPIITSAGFYTPIRDFRANLRPILLLALGCVIFTMTVIALAARFLLPELPWAAAFTLGAIVAPTDAAAATSIAQRLNLPRRIVTVLEGESLVNDASALVAYRVAVAAALTSSFSFGAAIGDFALSSVGGVVIGLAVGWAVARLLSLIDDTPIEIITTFLGSYAAYLLAELLHVSGVLATVTLGLFIGYRSIRTMSARTRMSAIAVWDTVILTLNGLVFILIGLQLPTVLAQLGDRSLATLIGIAGAICLVLIISRFVWVFLATYLPRLFSARMRERDPSPSWRAVTIISWTGMRGIVSLAAALALPTTFPARNLILLLTFATILVTLVVQGLSLPWLIKLLGVVDPGGAQQEENKARLVAAKAGLARLEQLADADWLPADELEHVRAHYNQQRTNTYAQFKGTSSDADTARAAARQRLQNELLDAESEAVIKLRDSNYINDEVLRRIQRELDLRRLGLTGE